MAFLHTEVIDRNYIRNTLVCSPLEILQVQSGLIKSGWLFFDEIIFLCLFFLAVVSSVLCVRLVSPPSIPSVLDCEGSESELVLTAF